MKKCIVISDSFKGTLSSLEICEIARQSIPRFFPECEVVALPVADGGEGTVECFIHALRAEAAAAPATGPYGEEIQAGYCRAGNRAVIEMAAAAGLPMVGENRHAEKTSTYGVGQIIRHAVENGCTEILLGLGGSATNDGGCGCAAALGTKFLRENGEPFVPVGATMDQVSHIDISETKRILQGVHLTVMCDVDNPLCGENGAAYVFAPQKGADLATVELLDRNLSALAAAIRRDIGLSVETMPGAGAAGGMGAGCAAFLGAELKSGIEAVLDMVEFDTCLMGADLVITGEGRIDAQSIHGKVIAGVAKRTAPKGIPLVAIVGGIDDSASAAYDLGVTAMFGIDRQAEALEKAAPRSRSNYQKTLEDILRLIKAMEMMA